MHTPSRLNGEIALDPLESFGRIRRRHPSAATSPQRLSGRGADRTDSAPARDEIEAYALHAFAANGFGDAILGRAEQRFYPSGVRLDRDASAPRPSRLAQIVETLRAVGTVARQRVARWKQQRVARATYVALRELDTRTLRDLGFDRSEIRSIAAEAAGQIDSTRARLVLARHDLPR